MTAERSPPPRLPALLRWSVPGRLIVFALASASIGCLLAEFYGVGSTRAFALAVFLPAALGLAAPAALDRARGDGRVWRAVVVGGAAGLVAACAYHVFRLPFVFAAELGLDAVVPPLDLFKVLPRFGAVILGEPAGQPAYSVAAHLTGWAYHFSNGAAFGVMYLAAIWYARRRGWGWAVPMAAGLEVAVLLTPYPAVFATPLTPTFVAVTLAAHLTFGVALGLAARRGAAAAGVAR